jgi:hypothetical protein
MACIIFLTHWFTYSSLVRHFFSFFANDVKMPSFILVRCPCAGLFSNHSPLYFVNTKRIFSKMGLTCHIARIHSEVTELNRGTCKQFSHVYQALDCSISSVCPCTHLSFRPGISGEKCTGTEIIH